MHCAVPFFCARSGTEGEAAWRCGEWVVRSAGNASRSLRACVGAAGASGSAREGRVAVRGREKAFGGECVVGSAGNASSRGGGAEVFGEGMGCEVGGFNALSPQRLARTRIIIIRPPRHRREIAAMGRKGAPAKAHRPPNDVRPCRSDVCTSAPAFTLPPHTLRRRPRRFRPSAAAVIHNRLSTEKLSTSLLAALCKTFSPSRLRTRIYNISFARRPLPRVSASLRGRGRAVVTPCPAPPSAGWGRAKAKADAASRSNPPLPAYGRAPARLCAESLCAKAEVHKAIPAPARAFFPRQPAYRRAPARRWAKCRAQGGGGRRQRRTPPRAATRPSLPTAAPPPPKWAPRLRRREGKRPNGAPPHRTAHTSNAERKRYLHNSRTKTQRRTKRCAQFVFFVFTPCKLLHNFSTVLHRSPRNVPESAQIAARRSDFPCFTARFPNVLPESHRAKHPRTAPVLPPKNAPLRAYAKPRSHPRVRGTRQHATTCAFFTFSVRYERIAGPLKTNFCPAEGRKWGRLWSQMLKNGLQTKKSTFSFGRLVI